MWYRIDELKIIYYNLPSTEVSFQKDRQQIYVNKNLH